MFIRVNDDVILNASYVSRIQADHANKAILVWFDEPGLSGEKRYAIKVNSDETVNELFASIHRNLSAFWLA